MAYNPAVYNQYQQQMFQQPASGIITVDSIAGVEMFQLPPNSVSPPLFLATDNVFFVKTTDGGGASKILRYRFDEEFEAEEPAESNQEYVTKRDFDDFANRVMEVINGKQASGDVGKSE